MSYGPACRGCSGEDCQCCEVWVEYQADLKAEQNRDSSEDFYDRDEDYCEKCGREFCVCGEEDEIDEREELPFDENCEVDTPLGEQYDDLYPDFDG